MFVLFIYVGIGVGLAVIGLCIPSFGRRIDRMAAQSGMNAGYGRVVWFCGTVIAWPIGVFVLATGRLVLAGIDPSAVDDAGAKQRMEEPLPTGSNRLAAGDRPGP